ncbi:Toll-like receptor TOL-1, partial [Meloidogyne graminicola]
LEELPEFIKNNKKLQKIYLSGNLFRCDCSFNNNERFQTQWWILQNKEIIKDIEKIQCVENVTKSKEFNDTTIFSNYFPNINDDLFVMSMMEFLNQENKTICIKQTKGILFGINEIYDI